MEIVKKPIPPPLPLVREGAGFINSHSLRYVAVPAAFAYNILVDIKGVI